MQEKPNQPDDSREAHFFQRSPATSLKPLGHLIDAPQLLVVRADFPADAFADFLKYAKAHPAKVNCASSGNGSLQHVTTELLKDLTKTFMVHIAYRAPTRR